MAAKQAGLLLPLAGRSRRNCYLDLSDGKGREKNVTNKKKTLNNVNRMFKNKDLTIGDFQEGDS
jgi:hypothetical protein